MYKYAIIGDQLRVLCKDTRPIANVMGDVPPLIIGVDDKWNKTKHPYITDCSRITNHGDGVVVVDVSMNTSNYPNNPKQVKALIEEIILKKLTSIQKVYPRLRIQVMYKLVDECGNTIEEGSKVRIGDIFPVIKIQPINSSMNEQEYSEAVGATNTIDFTINPVPFGISRNNNSRKFSLFIEDVIFSIAMCDDNVTDSYMTEMQQRIGWSRTSPTQEELGEYFYTIYQASTDDPHWSSVEISDLNRCMKVFVNITSIHDLFANVYDCKQIEHFVLKAQEMQMLYTVETSVDGETKDTIKDIAWGSSRTVKVHLDNKVNTIEIRDSRGIYEAVRIAIKESDYDEDGNLHFTYPNGLIGITGIYDKSSGGTELSLSFPAVEYNIVVDIQTHTELLTINSSVDGVNRDPVSGIKYGLSKNISFDLDGTFATATITDTDSHEELFSVASKDLVVNDDGSMSASSAGSAYPGFVISSKPTNSDKTTLDVSIASVTANYTIDITVTPKADPVP